MIYQRVKKKNLFNSKEFTPNEYEIIKSSFDKFKSFTLTFSGILDGSENKPMFTHPFDEETILKKHQNWIVNDFYNEIINLINDISEEIITHKVYTDVDIRNKNFKLKYLSRIVGAFVEKQSFDGIMNELKELKTPKMSNNNIEEDLIEDRQKLKNWKDYVNKQFKTKIDKIFENFKSLNYKLKIELDENADISIEIDGENEVSASSLNYQGKDIVKLMKLIYIINLCIYNFDRWNWY